MISINLLPVEERKNVGYQQQRLPVVPILLLVFFFLLILWIGFLLSITHHKMGISARVNALQKIASQKAEVDSLWSEVNENLSIRKTLIDTVLLSPIEWAQVLNIISNQTAQGIWFSDLAIEKKDGVWLMNLSGYAKEVTSQATIKDIGMVIQGIKDGIEASLLAKRKGKTGSKDFIEVSNTTKRKKADMMELTEFVATYKIRV